MRETHPLKSMMQHLPGKSPVHDTLHLHPSIEDSEEESLHRSNQKHIKGELQPLPLDLHK